MSKRGPAPAKDSFNTKGLKKSFYIYPENWDSIELHVKETAHSKSEIINKAIQLYFTDLMEPPNNDSKNWSVISLFSGCGGMDIGFEGGFKFLNKYYNSDRTELNKSFEIVLANDIFKDACNDYRNYFKQKTGKTPNVINRDIAEFLDEVELRPQNERIKIFPETCDVVIGGFPCQDFSVAGKRKGLKSDRGKLYLQMKRVIEMTSPKIFIAENVKGLTNLGGALQKIKDDFANTGTGYYITHKLHMAADFGVPQTRERVFICGIRKDLDPEHFNFPLETHSMEPDDTGLLPWVTSNEAIGDLIEKPKFTNQHQYSKAKNYGAHLQGNKPIKRDYPSPTIRAEHHGNIEFHYSLERRLSIRECARIQTFPDDYEFISSASKAYKEIGNAVPPVLGWHIAQSVANALAKWEK